MVKLFALILSVFVLFLTTVPCCALENEQIHHHEQKINSDHNQDDDCCKDCSPFYVCGTCVGFTLSSYSQINFSLYLRPVLHENAYFPIETTKIPTVIWQPPKLS